MERNYEFENTCNRELARCYVPFQIMNQVYDNEEALRRGTLFPELYKPYVIKGENRMEGYYG